jgi:hypothetical protein
MPYNNNLNARLEIYPRVELMFYSMFGPFAEIVPFIEGNYNSSLKSQITPSGSETFLAWDCGINLGLDFRIGSKLSFLGLFNKIAKALGATSNWAYSSTTGSVGNTDYPEKRNISGFTALQGGYRTGAFYLVGEYGDWWTATEYDTWNAWARGLYFDNPNMDEDYDTYSYGKSVRCIKD